MVVCNFSINVFYFWFFLLFIFSFTLYLRLFIVMGVTWSMEAISFFISAESDFFLLTDICNTIQGVLIFVLFVMKRRIFRLIKKRFVYMSNSWEWNHHHQNETNLNQTQKKKLLLYLITLDVRIHLIANLLIFFRSSAI